MNAATYNYESFHRSTLKEELQFRSGPEPGQSAPDFDLETTEGRRFRLSECRNRMPVLLEFGSISCPMAAAAIDELKRLHAFFGERVQFVTVYVRETHPGERYPHHQSLEQKRQHAVAWKRADGILWTVAVDTLDGSVHRSYGAVPNAVFLIDSTGQVAFRALFAAQEKVLAMKLGELVECEKNGQVPANLGEEKRRMVPLIKSARHFDHAVARAGQQAVQDYRREMGPIMYGFERLMSRMGG